MKREKRKKKIQSKDTFLIKWAKCKCNVWRIEGLSDEDDGDGVEDIVQHGDKYCSKVKSWYFKESLQTWCHRSPVDAPASLLNSRTSTEYKFDNIGSGCDGGRQGGADVLASNPDAIRGGAAALLHQGCSVAVHDCQVVVVTGGMIPNLKCRELQWHDESLRNLYSVCPLKVVWIVVGVVWRGDNTFG